MNYTVGANHQNWYDYMEMKQWAQCMAVAIINIFCRIMSYTPFNSFLLVRDILQSVIKLFHASHIFEYCEINSDANKFYDQRFS